MTVVISVIMPFLDSLVDSIAKWSNNNLKEELRNNHLSQAGNKDQLVHRLQQFLRRQATEEQANNQLALDDTTHSEVQNGGSPPESHNNDNTVVTFPSPTLPVQHSRSHAGPQADQVITNRNAIPALTGSSHTLDQSIPRCSASVNIPLSTCDGVPQSSYSQSMFSQNPGILPNTSSNAYDPHHFHNTGSTPITSTSVNARSFTHRSASLFPDLYATRPRPAEPHTITQARRVSFFTNMPSPSFSNPPRGPGLAQVSQQQSISRNITPHSSMYDHVTPVAPTDFPVHSHQQGVPNMASTRLDHNTRSNQSEADLEVLEKELKILRTKEDIRNTSYRLTLAPEACYQDQANGTGSSVNMSEFNQTMLELVKRSVDISKQSVDISSLPPAQPFVFSGKRIDYPRWKSMFDLLVETKSLLPCQKLIYLGQFLEGEALKSVRGYISQNTPEAYAAAKEYLDWKYGDPYDMADEYREKLESWRKLSSEDFKGLSEYADFLGEILVATSYNLELTTLNDPRILKGFPNVLPYHLTQKWSRLAGSMKYEKGRHANFEEYCRFVKKEAFLANDNTTSMEAITSSNKNPGRRGVEKTTVTHTTNTASPAQSADTSNSHVMGNSIAANHSKSNTSKATICHMCKLIEDHNTTECDKVCGLNETKFQEFVARERLCFRCLRKGHAKAQCNVKLSCSICQQQHPTCLHKAQNKEIVSKPNNNQAYTVVSNRVCGGQVSGLTSMIVPVYVSLDGKSENEVMVYALIDSQSDASFIDKSVLISGDTNFKTVQLEISTVTTKKHVVDCLSIPGLQVRGIYSEEPVTIPHTYTQDNIPGKREHIPTPDTARSWTHLRKLESKLSPLQDCEIGLLIGYNCPAASFPLNCVKNTPMEPYGLETPLGWMVVGGVPSDTENWSLTHRIHSRELSSNEILKCLQETVESDSGEVMSQNNRSFLKMMDSELTITEGFYTMPLPFKQEPELPNNRHCAVKRFHLLERKFNQNPQFKMKYKEFMDDILAKGEAEACTSEEPGWFIPHFGVFNQQKPEKIRVVFDCSATFRGQSLNQNLLQGPDLNSSLSGLLCRFRKDRVAITCDIKKMFHQFRVNTDHRKYLKFIWYEGNGSSALKDYRMNVHLFGAVSSPSCAIYGLQQLARDHAEEYPQASSFILENFYVDDGLISVPTAEDAIQLLEDATALTKKGNLTLHKFLSNNSTVAKAIGCDGPTSKDLHADKEMTAKALGLCWNVDTDSFHFSDRIPEKAVSRRGILSTVASMYDPLGLISPFTLTGKLFIQELCREKKSWDEDLSTEQQNRWIQWLGDLANVNNIQVGRCFLGKNQKYSSCELELHTFSDACEYGYGVCSYLRIIDTTTELVSVSLVMGKARVTPQKILTIPRLELQAATLAVKVTDFLLKELDFQEISSYYWTDSKTVLGYIRNEEKRYHTFVLNRVARIRESTLADQWHYVSTSENPADVASRGAHLDKIPPNWFNGPKFLSNHDFHMKDQPLAHYPVKTDDPEVKKVFAHALTTGEKSGFLQFFDKFSSWRRVFNIFILLLKFGSKQPKTEESVLNEAAFTTIVLVLQKNYFTDELERLKEGSNITKTSCLYKLDPFIAANGVLRVGGRLKDSLSPYGVRHPAVLPSQAHLTKLYAQHIHKQTGHQGKNVTINHIRTAGVHLTGHGSRMVSSMVFKCVQCLKIRGRPSIPKMANLPSERIEPTAPFTNTGMDVFGPYHCKDGRKEVKRYGLIFSCMSTRAVHLEMLDDMTTDCFINSLRCFLAIRGSVQSLLCDRGTNFIGAKNELQRAIEIIEDQKLQEFLQEKQCSFKFNVPLASHMAGSWERMIRIIRNVMAGILCEQASSRLDSSALRTLMYECMAIVNSRPLTTAQLPQDSSIEPVPLTPNMMLTMKTIQNTSPGDFTQTDLYSRKRWRRIQYLAEQFWARWRVEYLSQLQTRQKWICDQGKGVKLEDIVLMVDEASPRCNWKLARVVEIFASKDGRVRKVKLRLGEGQRLERPVHKLIVLVPSEINIPEKN